ncbi:hypothetical protein R3P38DRAFT_3385109 [Favolaschia claudopus]|uniref:Uncharacterized protein n=1 Tax=Favolaschia claudopus TaxID=2862362 RepID=A0AAW0E198_9AGAR
MTQLTDPANSSRTSESKNNTIIHNHITKHSTNLDVSPVVNALNAFMRSTQQCAYPQLMVTCRDQRIAFSRESLASMSHKRAADLFVQRFAEEKDFVDVPGGGSWLTSGGRRHAPAVDSSADATLPAVQLDPSGWTDNIRNVRELTVVLTRKAESQKERPSH